MISQSTETDAYKFLNDHDIAVISTVSSKGQPTAAVIYYMIDEDFNVYFVTKSDTRKFQNLQDNNKLAFTVFDEPKRFTVQAEGSAHQVEDEAKQAEIMNVLAKLRTNEESAWFPPIAMLRAGKFVVMKVHLDHIQVANYDASSNNTSDVLEDIRS